MLILLFVDQDVIVVAVFSYIHVLKSHLVKDILDFFLNVENWEAYAPCDDGLVLSGLPMRAIKLSMLVIPF